VLAGSGRHIEKGVVMEFPRALDDHRPQHLRVLDERSKVAGVGELPDDPDPGASEERRPKQRRVLVGCRTVGRGELLQPVQMIRRPDRERGSSVRKLVVALVALGDEDEGIP